AGSDTLATSYTLSRAITKIADYDLIICGRQTIDGDTAQVGPEISEMLNLPFISYVSKVEEIENGKMRVERLIEEGHEVIEAPLPAVITVTKEINVPRLPSLRGIMKSKSATIQTWGADDLEVDSERVGRTGSPTWVMQIFFPQRVSEAEIIEGSPDEQVDKLVEKLKETKLV
ncbi:electron transfer flavoprotein subunit beta/FixA family protein, partial [Chloroflexota bacterium]